MTFLARRTLAVAGRTVAQTPLLLPAYSGRAVLRERLERTLVDTLDAVLGPVLLSAYDLHDEDLGAIDALLEGAGVPFVLLDSGGYELIQVLGAGMGRKRDWSRAAHAAVVSAWPPGRPLVAASYDDPEEGSVSVGMQVERASTLFASAPSVGRCLLIRSPQRDRFLAAEDVRPHVDDLRAVDVLGVTEKDAGADMVSRMRLLRALRLTLDEAGLALPIHVFGGLDPFMSAAYLLAGADVFDGLSWLRYAFANGLVLGHESHAVLRSPDLAFAEARLGARRANLRMMADLQVAMRRVADGAPLDEFGPISTRLAALRGLAFPGEP